MSLRIAAATLLLAGCVYDLDPYQATAGGGGSAASVTAAETGATNAAAATGASSDAGATVTAGEAVSSSTGVVDAEPYPFCTDADPLDEPDNWNDGNQVEFASGAVQIGPDNNLSWITWHDDVELTAPCVLTTRVVANQGVASFGLRKNSNSQLYVRILDGSAVDGLDPAVPPVPAKAPLTLALVLTGRSLVTAFRDADGWHRVDEVAPPPWIGDGLRPVMTKAGDDLQATFDAFNGDALRPSEIGEPPL